MERGGTNINSVVIGAGRAGERFAQALGRAGNPTTIFDTDPVKALAVARKTGVSTFRTSDLRRAVDYSQVVYICTPIDQHYEGICQAIGGNRLVFCEKPVVRDIRQAFDVQKRVKKSGSELIVGNYFRLNSPIQRALHMVQTGYIGDVTAIYANYLHDMSALNQETPWRAVPGMFLWDGRVHPVDLVNLIANRPVMRVAAHQGLGEHYSLDLIYQGGLLANVRVDATAKVPVHGTEIEVLGTRGIIKAHSQGTYCELSLNGSSYQRLYTPQFMQPIDQVVAYINGAIRTGRRDATFLPRIDEAVQAVNVLDAAQRSVKNLGSPVVLRL